MKDSEIKAGHFDLYTNKTHLAFAKIHRPLLDHYHLCMNALMILEVLNENADCKTPKELGRILGLKSNVIYLHIDQLVADGYLDRHTAENDRRKITLSCTRKAKTMLKKAEAIRTEYRELMTQGISQEDFEIYRQVIKRIEQNIDDFLNDT